MRRKLVVALFSVIAILAIAVSPVYAITGNFVEDDVHDYVGLVVFYDAEGEFIWRCTGTLISNQTLLTAGHCADTEGGAVTARVYFQQDAGANYDPATQVDPVTGYPEYCADGTLGVTCATGTQIYTYPEYDEFAGWPVDRDTSDIGVVILDQAIALPEYGQLAEPGTLDELHEARGLQDV